MDRNTFNSHDRFRFRGYRNFTVKHFAKYCFQVLVARSWNEQKVRIAYLRFEIGRIDSRLVRGTDADGGSCDHDQNVQQKTVLFTVDHGETFLPVRAFVV